MASFKKTPSGSYQATIFIGRDINGKQLFKYITKKTLKECKSAAREIEQDIEDRKYTNKENMRASTWFNTWLEINQNKWSPSTYISYKMYIDKHFEPAFKLLKLGQITETHIKQYINNKLKHLSPTTVRKHVFVLREIFYDALKLKSPCLDIEPPKPEKYVPYIPTEQELGKTIQFFREDIKKGLRDEIIILLGAWCGLREGEIFALKENDIRIQKNEIVVDENRAVSENGYVDKKPKSDNGVRIIATPEYLIGLICIYIALKKENTERIFMIRPDSYSTYFNKKIKSNKDIPTFRFHDLRHYHATWLYNKGIPDLYAAQRLGHSINVLKGIYQHLGLDIKEEIDATVVKNIAPKRQISNEETQQKTQQII